MELLISVKEPFNLSNSLVKSGIISVKPSKILGKEVNKPRVPPIAKPGSPPNEAPKAANEAIFPNPLAVAPKPLWVLVPVPINWANVSPIIGATKEVIKARFWIDCDRWFLKLDNSACCSGVYLRPSIALSNFLLLKNTPPALDFNSLNCWVSKFLYVWLKLCKSLFEPLVVKLKEEDNSPTFGATWSKAIFPFFILLLNSSITLPNSCRFSIGVKGLNVAGSVINLGGAKLGTKPLL